MAELEKTLPLGGFAKDWPGFTIQEHYKGEMVSLACSDGEENTLSSAFKKNYGKPLPLANEMIQIKDGIIFWSGQNQYMMLLGGENSQADIKVARNLGGSVYTTLQSDGWASIDITGMRVFDVLERFIPLDLRRAPKHFATRTNAHHIACIVLKVSETEIQLMTPRSSAQSFVQALAHVADNVLT